MDLRADSWLMSVNWWSFSKAAVISFFQMNLESLWPFELLSLLSRGMLVPFLKTISLGKNATLFKLFLILWNFLKLLSCGSKFNHSHFGHGFVSTVMCVSNHRVSFLYFYINMIPFVYLFLRGFTFAYVMDYGILQSLPHAGISFFFVPPDASYSWLYSLGSLVYNALSWWVGVGGSQIIWWLLHPSSHKSCLGLSPHRFCTQSFGIFQNVHWLKTTATIKSNGFWWGWKIPGFTSGLGTGHTEFPEPWSYIDYSHRVWSWKWSVSYAYPLSKPTL